MYVLAKRLLSFKRSSSSRLRLELVRLAVRAHLQFPLLFHNFISRLFQSKFSTIFTTYVSMHTCLLPVSSIVSALIITIYPKLSLNVFCVVTLIHASSRHSDYFSTLSLFSSTRVILDTPTPNQRSRSLCSNDRAVICSLISDLFVSFFFKKERAL